MISAVVLTKNEEENIKDCLKSLGFCDEVVVVDDKSTDSTRELAKKMGSRVFIRDMAMNYSLQSNFGMKKTRGDWILFLDADERISENLRKEIAKEVKSDNAVEAYRLKRIDYMWGKWLTHGESGAFRAFRLVRKNSGSWVRRVHPFFEMKGRTQILINPIHHYPHQNLRKFLASINRWSTWHAIANKEEGKNSNLVKIVIFPLAHFFRNFVFRGGFLDGMQGLVFALVMSSHSFLAWSKLWLLQKGFTKI